MRTFFISLLTTLLRLWFRRKPAPIIEAPRSVLIIKPCCLGDVLLTTPLVAAIREGYPAARITYATGSWSRPMVATSHHIDDVLTLPDQWTLGCFLATIRVLRSRQFDLVFVPDRSPTLTLLAWLARVPLRVGLDSLGRGFAYTHPVPVPAFVTHEAEVYSSLAFVARLSPPRRLFFFPTQEAIASASEIVQQRPTKLLIALHPGGGQNPGMSLPRKRWLPEHWAAVADQLIEQHKARIILLGGPSDQQVVDAVVASMRYQAETYVMRWNWVELGALLQQTNLFLGHDTGMMHLATAVETPVVAVFGPSDPQIYGPYGERVRFVWKPTVQSPCFYNGEVVTECSCAMQCMRNVAVADVLAAINMLLADDHIEGSS